MKEDITTILVVDDETPARNKVKRLLEHRRDVSVVGEASTAGEARLAIATARPEIVILDIRMAGESGLELAEAMCAGPDPADRAPEVIFATAYEEHAVRAFELAAVDYLLKPFDRSRLDQAVDRAIHRRRSGDPGAMLRTLLESLVDGGAGRTFMRRIAVDARGRHVVLDLAEVTHFAAEGNYVGVWREGREFLVRRTLRSIEADLDPRVFVRVHRSSIVNAAHVREIVPVGRGDRLLRLTGGGQVRMSRSYRTALDQAIHPGSGTPHHGE